MKPLNMTGRYPPHIVTPDFWPADEGHYRLLLEELCPGEYEVLGYSAGGREIWGWASRVDPARPTLAVVGGMHGHESQGPASCFNLLSVLRRGHDLKGQAWPELMQANWAIVFCLNPDARARMPNAFVGLSVKDVQNYDSGLMADGSRKSEPGDADLSRTMILGGLFNDAGVDILRHPDLADKSSPERDAVLDFITRTRPRVCLELHAHCALPQFYCPLTPVPQEVAERQVRLTEALIAAARSAGFEFAENTGEVAGLTNPLYWEVGGAVPLLFESPQGVLDMGPHWDYARIIDVNLFVMAQLARLVETL